MKIELKPVHTSSGIKTYIVTVDELNLFFVTEKLDKSISFDFLPEKDTPQTEKVVFKEIQVHPFNKLELDVIENCLAEQPAKLVYNTLVTLIKYRSQFPVSNVPQTKVSSKQETKDTNVPQT